MTDRMNPGRDIYANRTLNLRSIEAIGYDMDYTLLHYRTEEWEGAAFEHARRLLAERGFPVADLTFEADRYLQGLVIDLDLGNLVKATRFGYVIQAQHGTSQLTFDELRKTYANLFVDLGEPRFRFLNTMFSISEAALYAQLVDRLDAEEITGPLGYDELYREVSSALDQSHAIGTLKAEIAADPDRFCDLDPDTAQTLLDQRLAGKRLLLITNSEWSYTRAMMSYAFDRHVPSGSWRDLFDIVVVAAAKPRFFAEYIPAFRMVDTERGLLQPHRGPLQVGDVYHGACARLVEQSLGLDGSHILYAGDHLFGDVHVTKSVLRWRTALIMRELETDIADANRFAKDEAELRRLMAQKIELEDMVAQARLAEVRRSADESAPEWDGPSISQLLEQLRELDQRITPLAKASAELGNPTWGPMMRAGNDKSMFARQVERYADVYTSRVANFGLRTPYAFLRAARTSLPHDVISWDSIQE
ncbi:HAD-IG family 5'-nucleotidase [Phytoactinopolyspora halotolerans]|uniref:HAD-IG family 5'-nucleotidase n=1 Tax=Phytoactinopolyspora halotolerans TaxID=1981512 RepID=A0A6L9S8U6_9ACTN|nr:HAD-IG family 5'-nucleotidase [Phytoactinopolyspora halotolerans]NEE01443.1 HAD-IG family 5'-nucleotidase [Phytoactinopolyspora halotolerans]